MSRFLHILDVARALWWTMWRWDGGPLAFWRNYRWLRRYYKWPLTEEYWRYWRDYR